MSDLQGKTIGEYQLISVVDRGGTATVYKGFQPKLNRYVAVKVLNSDLAQDPAAVQQFLQQAELNGRLEHRSILPVYDFGQEGEVVYRVSPFIETGTLREHLSSFYDPRTASRLFFQLAEALNYINSQGYIHGNLKPTNIFLDDSQRPLLTDFGYAQHPGATPSVYTSPEQAQGGTVDRRTDVYSLGVLLYEVLVGEPPPIGVVASPRAKRPDLPQDVEMVVFKAMAQSPEQRYQTAGEFAQALDAALRPQVAPVPPPVQPTPVAVQPTPVEAKPKRDTSWLVFLLGGIFIVILIACAVVFLPTILGGDEDGTGAVTDQPAITQVLPTDEPEKPPQDTKEPRPTREPPPTEEPLPPTEDSGRPPPEQATQPPEGGGEPGGGIGDICGSLGIAGGAAIFSFGWSKKKRKNSGSPDSP
jgi:serine/threonine protein kinase